MYLSPRYEETLLETARACDEMSPGVCRCNAPCTHGYASSPICSCEPEFHRQTSRHFEGSKVRDSSAKSVKYLTISNTYSASHLAGSRHGPLLGSFLAFGQSM